MYTFSRALILVCVEHVNCVSKCGETRSLEAQRGASLSTGPTHMLSKEPLITCLTADAQISNTYGPHGK